MTTGHCDYNLNGLTIKCERKTGGSPHTVVVVAADQRAFWCWRQETLSKRYPADYDFFAEYQGKKYPLNFHLVQQAMRPAQYTGKAGLDAVEAIWKIVRGTEAVAEDRQSGRFVICAAEASRHFLSYEEAAARAEQIALKRGGELVILQAVALVRKPVPRAEVVQL